MDLGLRFADVPAKCVFVDCNSMHYSPYAKCCVSDVIIVTELVVIVVSSSCREAPAIRKAMNGCELRTGDEGASLHEEFPLSCPFPLSTCLRFDFYCGQYLQTLKFFQRFNVVD